MCHQPTISLRSDLGIAFGEPNLLLLSFSLPRLQHEHAGILGPMVYHCFEDRGTMGDQTSQGTDAAKIPKRRMLDHWIQNDWIDTCLAIFLYPLSQQHIKSQRFANLQFKTGSDALVWDIKNGKAVRLMNLHPLVLCLQSFYRKPHCHG